MTDGHHQALLQGDAESARQLAHAELEGGASPERTTQLTAAVAFTDVLRMDFSAAYAVARTLDQSDPLAVSVTALAAAMSGTTSAPTAEQAVVGALSIEVAQERDEWTLALAGEAAMSAGRVDLAEQASRQLWDTRRSPTSVFAGQTLLRALLFQGRLVEATELGPRVIARADEHGLTGLGILAAAALAYVAVLRADREALDRCFAHVRRDVDACPPGYFANGSLILCAYALAADGRAEVASDMLLRAAGGPDLPGIQLVDRAYGYELLVTAALGVGDLVAARSWVSRSQRMDAPRGSMAAAALRRAQARLLAAEGDATRGAGLAEQARELAAASAGHLDATRASLLAGSTLLADASASVAARTTLLAASGQATDMGAVSLAVLARRDLRSIGMRFVSEDHAQLTSRELQVAELVIAGLTNGQIARSLAISERTVQTHVSSVLRALGLPSRTGVVGRLAGPDHEPAPRGLLTTRQCEVADLVVQGYTNDGIARALSVSVKTVEKHLGDAYRRLEVDSRTSLAARWQHDRVPTGDPGR